MTFHGPSLRKLALSTMFFSLSLYPAFAQDATAVAERLKASLAAQSVDISWTGVTGNASSMVLESVSLKPVGEKDGFDIGNVSFENVTEADGGYVAETVTTEAYKRQEKDLTVTISPIIIHGLAIPAADASTSPIGPMLLYRSAEIANFSVMAGEKTAFSMDNARADITPPTGDAAMEFSGSAERFNADLTLVKDPRSKDIIEGLGYKTISGSFKASGSWQPSDGRMQLTKYDISVDDAGTFGITFDVGGYTLDFIRSLQEMQRKMAEQPEGADKSAQGMAMLGLMQQLTFNNVTVRFTDNSLTNRALEHVGKKQGMSGRDIANQAKAIVPFALAQLNNPELTAQAAAAVSAFLDKPGSLQISATPPAPVPFALIIAGAMSNPADLTKTLGVTVKANGN